MLVSRKTLAHFQLPHHPSGHPLASAAAEALTGNAADAGFLAQAFRGADGVC
jgi:hypothetical protein